jgi:hypothetical protein
MGFSCELLARQFVINLHGKLRQTCVPLESNFSFVSLRQTAQSSENEALPFTKRTASRRGPQLIEIIEGVESMVSPIVLFSMG